MIEVKGLTKSYGSIEAVRDLSFNIEKGEIVGFLGPNGAGKTTTMRVLTGFIPATSGTAIIAGFDVHKQPIDVRRLTGYLPESVPLGPNRSMIQGLNFSNKGARKSGLDRILVSSNQKPRLLSSIISMWSLVKPITVRFSYVSTILEETLTKPCSINVW